MDNFEVVIGLEIHIQLNTVRKMFCNCSNNIWGKKPNTHTCPVCLGLPGALPVPNNEAIKKCQTFGLALNCTLAKNSNFDRKHYFYHDLPKGYQISQYKLPFCYNGYLDLPEGRVDIIRIHLEEDTAKSIHDTATNSTLIDFNKSGVPLMEIVTAPVIKSAAHAVDYAKQIAYIAEFIGVSNVNMEQGNLRVEPSISLRKKVEKELPNYKVELKNINSFKFMKQAIEYEIQRQLEELKKGNKINQQTRGWNESKKITFLQREKETESDYRYFPEPDIPPFEFSDEYIKDLKLSMPKLPFMVVTDFVTKYKVQKSKVEELLRIGRLDEANLLVNYGLSAEESVKILLSATEQVRQKIKQNPKQFVSSFLNNKNLEVSDTGTIEEWVNVVLSENEKSVNDFKSGKNPKAIDYLMGQVMRLSKGKASAGIVKLILEKKIK